MERDRSLDDPESLEGARPLADSAGRKSDPEMNLQPIEHEILSLATEDYQALWEIRSQVEQLWPALGQDVKEAVTQAVLNLLERGWIEIFEGLLDGRPPALARDLAKETLRGATVWDLPQADSRDLWIAATDAGEQAYFKGALAITPSS